MKKLIDNTDSKIIKLLQKDGRLSNTEIARELNISEATVRSRVKKLIDDETIQIVAVSNPFRLGYEITGDLYISTEMKKTELVLNELNKIDELWFIVMTTGRTSINAEFIVRTLEDLNELIHNRISKIDGVLNIESSVITKYIKRRYDYGTA